MSESILTTASIVRQLVLHHVESIPEELFDVQPPMLNNTIRWNVGHIVFWMDSYLSLCFSMESEGPTTYASWFDSGTKPSNWTVAPPAKKELVEYLSQQLSRISEVSPASLDRPLTSPVPVGHVHLNTVGELLNFAFIHEAMHLSTVGCLARIAQYKG